MTDYVLTGLAKRRSELTGQIALLHDRLSQMLSDLENLDKTNRQINPTFYVETIRPRHSGNRQTGPAGAR
jgi:hypothetical protein